MTIYLASDHAGFELKEAVKEFLMSRGHRVEDFGAHRMDPDDDYPDFVMPAARAVAGDPVSRGIVFGGSGQGEAMAANRVKGIRAAVFYGGPEEIIRLSRRHNDANILSIGARFIAKEDTVRAVALWLETPFDRGRHEKRIRKLEG